MKKYDVLSKLEEIAFNILYNGKSRSLHFCSIFNWPLFGLEPGSKIEPRGRNQLSVYSRTDSQFRSILTLLTVKDKIKERTQDYSLIALAQCNCCRNICSQRDATLLLTYLSITHSIDRISLDCTSQQKK